MLRIKRTLAACLAFRLYLVYYLSWGKGAHCFFTPPPCTFHHSISTGLIWLIKFEVVLKSFIVQTYFFFVRRISRTNATHIVSWSRNFVFKVNKWRFLAPGWVGGHEKICVLMTPDQAPHLHCSSFWIFETGFPHFWYIWILLRHI